MATTISILGCTALLPGCGEDELHGQPLVPQKTCDPGFQLVGEECIKICGVNERPEGAECVCINGFERVQDICIPVCAANTERNAEGQCVCIDGYEMVNGTCVPKCQEGWVRVDGICVPPAAPGAVDGRVCNQTLGLWMADVAVTLQLPDGGNVSTTTDNNGYFKLENIPAGSYYLHYEGTNGWTYDEAVEIKPGITVTVGATQCLPPPGQLQGAVCDEVLGLWLANAAVKLNDAAGTTTLTNQFGRFVFHNLPPGNYVLTITHASGYTASRPAKVDPGATTELGPDVCTGAPGSVHGRICGAEGYWLTNATVSTTVNGNTVSTTTDGDGFYHLLGLPPGHYTIHVKKGSFEMDFEVDVRADSPTNLPDPICIPPVTKMVVVTGDYDKVENILKDLGYKLRNSYWNSTTPVVLDANGTVDVIVGNLTSLSAFWFNQFLADPVWMSEYNIIFFDCGLNDAPLAGWPAAVNPKLDNLRNFVSAGGSVYASDWASEIIRLAFPGRVLFQGGNNTAGAARLGYSDPDLVATITDSGLASAVGMNSASINLNLSQWVVMEKVSNQPSGLRVLLKTDETHVCWEMQEQLDGTFICLRDEFLTDIPLTLRFEMGQGRVLYTSAHNETWNSPDLERILNYIIFEL